MCKDPPKALEQLKDVNESTFELLANHSSLVSLLLRCQDGPDLTSSQRFSLSNVFWKQLNRRVSNPAEIKALWCCVMCLICGRALTWCQIQGLCTWEGGTEAGLVGCLEAQGGLLSGCVEGYHLEE